MGLPRGKATLTPETQRANDTHRPLVVGVVIAVLVVYAYLFSSLTHHLSLPPPHEQLKSLARLLRFDEAGALWSRLEITDSSLSENDSLLIFFAVLGGAFLSAYFAPLRYKRPITACWFLLGFLTFYGWIALLLLLAAHIAVYLAFHPKARESPYLSALFGAFVPLAVLGGSWLAWALSVPGALAAAALYVVVISPWLAASAQAKIARTLIIQTPLIFGLLGVVYASYRGQAWELPLGLLFIIWQWQRLMVYQVDYQAGDVPADLPFLDYLSVFMMPGILANWHSAQYVGQGYAYLSSRFLNQDKNTIVLGGLRLWGVALVYLTLSQLVLQGVDIISHASGIPIYWSTSALVESYLKGIRMSTPTVLLSTLIDQGRIFLQYGSLTHFRIGTWRVLGHDVDPQYNRPWLATNLVSLWGRFAFHYREFLVRCFYYPVFFRFFKTNLYLRVFVATMVSTFVGNYIWGHVPVRLYSSGLTPQSLTLILRAWPYYLLLGLGISITQLYLMRKGRTRKPWTFDRRIGLDVLASYATLQYFSIIHIFARTRPDATLADMMRLFLIGFGIHI